MATALREPFAISIEDPQVADALQADLTTVKIQPNASRRRQLQSKEKMKRDGLKSPDGGDACALTFAIKVQPGNVKQPPRRAANWKVM